MYKYSKLYWFFKSFEWVGVYFSPFKLFLPKLYVGKTAVGVPYFLPRKWVKATPEKAHKAVLDYIAREESFNKRNPDYARKIRPYDEIFKDKMSCSYTVPKKIGFDFCGLGWKTKWKNTDYRHESNPIWSFVCLGYQIALIFEPKDDVHYWEMYLYYSRETKGNRRERIKQAMENFPCIWTSHSNGEKITTDYWKVCLKNKYL